MGFNSGFKGLRIIRLVVYIIEKAFLSQHCSYKVANTRKITSVFKWCVTNQIIYRYNHFTNLIISANNNWWCKELKINIRFNSNKIANQRISPVYYLMFIYCSTCSGRPRPHHQELHNCSSSLWFYRWSVVVAVLMVLVGPAGPTTTISTATTTLRR